MIVSIGPLSRQKPSTDIHQRSKGMESRCSNTRQSDSLDKIDNNGEQKIKIVIIRPLVTLAPLLN